MRKTLIVGLLALSAVTAQAADWNIIYSFEDGAKLVADHDSLEKFTYKKSKAVVGNGYSANVVLVTDRLKEHFVIAIDSDQCVKKGEGDLLVNVPGKTQAEDQVKSYYWSAQGDKIADIEGIWLCSKFMGSKSASPYKGLIIGKGPTIDM